MPKYGGSDVPLLTVSSIYFSNANRGNIKRVHLEAVAMRPIPTIRLGKTLDKGVVPSSVADLLHEDALIEIEIEAEIPEDGWETEVITGDE